MSLEELFHIFVSMTDVGEKNYVALKSHNF